MQHLNLNPSWQELQFLSEYRTSTHLVYLLEVYLWGFLQGCIGEDRANVLLKGL